jgi:hypothetical protein
MTKQLDDFFGLPAMDDLIEEDETIQESTQVRPKNNSNELMPFEEARGDHSQEMDDAHDEALKHAREIVELALELDPARSPRMFEVAAIFYKTAVDAKISKRDAQLKLMKLIQTQKKLDLDEMRLRHEMGNAPTDKSDVIMVEDRNTLLRRLREENTDK